MLFCAGSLDIFFLEMKFLCKEEDNLCMARDLLLLSTIFGESKQLSRAHKLSSDILNMIMGIFCKG